MTTLLPISAARVFFDGIFSEPRLAHPEGIAVHADGTIWCGTETGDLVRLAADGSSINWLATTSGFLLGIAFDRVGNCFACDLKHSAIFRYDAEGDRIQSFASSGIEVPNYPVVDDIGGWLYVSDSAGRNGGVYRYDLTTGEGGPWSREAFAFANGMAMAPDCSGLFVVESDGRCVSFVPIADDGSAGPKRLVVDQVLTVPDGLAFAADGSLFISCYEPSRIYRWRADRGLQIVIADEAATILAHPTNIAFKGNRLYSANLGRWHVTEIDLGGLAP
ncbi:MAG: SMP-30/gluconolactonase/LRE family protein [Ancalomicrobiaceae bacterium]|nr:SMP-30/gluconolactonase/LRE family protein [Ancalomicrobiaceae bacterium]